MMPRNLARSLPVAEQIALAGENDSQVSHEKLLFLIQEHGIGVTTSSPDPGDERLLSIKGDFNAAPTLNPTTERENKPRQYQHLKDASNALVDNPSIDTNAKINHTDAHVSTDTNAITVATSTPSLKRLNLQLCGQRSTVPHSSVPSLAGAIPRFTRSIPSDACPPSPRIPEDDIPLPALLKIQTRDMSSQSLTQLNEGRSYEQYTRDGSQPSSPPGTFAEEHRTLQEGDTGYVNFKYPFDLPDTAPVEPDTPLPRNDEDEDLHDRSQSISQMTTMRTNRFAPETPAAFPKLLLSGGDGQLMAASQLFGQTQPTSGLKKASPTSSRPSPNIFGNNMTSPTHPTSSPLKNRGVSATPLPAYTTSPGSSRSLANITSQSPSPVDRPDAGKDRDEDDPDKTPLPKFKYSSGKSRLEPINEYRSYRKQDLDNNRARPSSEHSLYSDFEQDEAELRRRRARLKKETASKSFPEISVPPSSTSTSRPKIEIPSTNRAKRTRDLQRTNSEEYIAQCHGKYATDNDGSQETVADSQDAITRQKLMSGSDTPALPSQDYGKSNHQGQDRSLSVAVEILGKETIPETSPACTFAEPPKLISDIMRENSSGPSGLLNLSYPTPSAIAPSDSLDKPSQSVRNVSAPPPIKTPTIDSISTASSPSIIFASSQQSTKRRSGRLKKLTTPTAPGSLLPSDPGTTSSTITVLSTTPFISSSLTPNTEDGRNEECVESVITVSSPAADRGQRRERLSSSLPNPASSLRGQKVNSHSRQSPRKGTRQSSRQSSLSLDELEKSTTTSTLGDSRVIIRKPPRKSTTLRDFQTKYGVFEGMVFAISFQDRQQSQRGKDKSLSKSSLEEMIRQEGGKILDDGFNTLFEFDTLSTSVKAPSTPVLSSSLNLLDNEIGFAALIADGHSRKVKYMQALALGIPCLAPKWVTACVSRKEIVDWSSYLLCAGSSALLGDAVRSRNIQLYDASTAKLAQVISQRPRLLGESKILLIMKKAKNEEKRLPYVFLAQVLGASLVRVNSVEEARAKLLEAESGNDAFDWVYVDDHLRDARTALFGAGPNEGAPKKRKRKSLAADAGNDRPPKRIRTLNDELVIQSLILGRLIEEDEMDD
ncbi:hypothetical protein GQX73_g1719 [Xylaria multiplex]|uniref:BRCT domain-containing protein n=1 Tax=Xylaria multiplex TaxID=323545 RepID=A0A7C8ITD3_9PEZI|nr:hypothetical protein GQX73_g1719 [Xylaria multiplex]